jgi:hypothetical protein
MTGDAIWLNTYFDTVFFRYILSIVRPFVCGYKLNNVNGFLTRFITLGEEV